MTSPKIDPRLIAELRRVKHDRVYAAEKYAKISTKKGKIIAFKPYPEQLRVWEVLDEHRFIYVLKARQIGDTTALAWYFSHLALLNPGTNIAVVAHTQEAVQTIFQIYLRYFENLPPHLKFPIECTQTEIVIRHSDKEFSRIKAGTANSESWRGGTWQGAHVSEFALFENIDKTLNSLANTVSDDGYIAIETTAQGLNRAREIWHDPESLYHKHFIPWTTDPGYVSLTPPLHAIPQILKDYAAEHKLTRPQLFWAAKTLAGKCGNDIRNFNQEYPVTAEVAFVSSGERVFRAVFPDAKVFYGPKVYEEPRKGRVYCLGADPASGSPTGDFSSYVVLDCTDANAPRIVSTYYDRITPLEFAKVVQKEAVRYKALVNVEANSIGAAVIEALVSSEYTRLYRRVRHDKLANAMTEQLGFQTTATTRELLMRRLHQYIDGGLLEVDDLRLQVEINTFQYNAHGRPEAQSGAHDDILMALAMALVAMDQTEDIVEEVTWGKRPGTIREQLEWESRTGLLIRDHQEEFWEPSALDMEDGGLQDIGSLLGRL